MMRLSALVAIVSLVSTSAVTAGLSSSSSSSRTRGVSGRLAFAPPAIGASASRAGSHQPAVWGTASSSIQPSTPSSTTALGVSMTPDLFMFENYKNEREERRNNKLSESLSAAFSSTTVAPPSSSPGTAADDPTKSTGQSQPPNGQDPQEDNKLPTQGPDKIFHIQNHAQHSAFFQSPAAADQIVVLKIFAPWCRACKGLQPKFLQLTKDQKFVNEKIPIQFADLSIQHNKNFVKSLGVLALPTIQFYVAGQLVDTFACGPAKVPLLKKKLAALINQQVDAATGQLKAEYLPTTTSTTKQEEEEKAAKPAAALQKTTAGAVQRQPLTALERAYFNKIPYFAELDLADQDDLLENKAKLVTFPAGSVIMREGEPGRTFYVVQDGAVEVCQSVQTDPLVATPADYLGTVINRMHAGDYFGERALITDEPRAASIRAAPGEKPVTAWVFDKADFPFSSVLSGRTKATDDKRSVVDDKYGLSLLEWQDTATDIVSATAKANQVRGSANSPAAIKGVDTEDDDEESVGMEDEESAAAAVPAVPQPALGGLGMTPGTTATTADDNDAILSLLNRFQLIRHVSRCFDYIVQTRASWGEEGIRQRRSMLVNRLTAAQRAEFSEAFTLIDASGDGYIELIELKRVMESIGETKSDEELAEMIRNNSSSSSSSSSLDARAMISKQDFLGIMAEAEFYHLFRDTFAALDKEDLGYVRAGDLDRVLSGVRGLISNDRKSAIIDIEDKDMLIEYEQFSRMLLGSALT